MLVSSALKSTPSEGHKPKQVCVLGSTGSIGTATLDIIRRNPAEFKVHSLVAGSNTKELQKQIEEFRPKFALLNSQLNSQPSQKLSPVSGCQYLYGTSAICDVVADPEIDLVMAAISGNFGVASTLAAINAGKVIALANKESLVCAGSYLLPLIEKSGAVIIPVDSEHSALFQALQGENLKDIERLILTASGGPFLNLPSSEFVNIKVEQALKHPRWEMGAKITIDSATLFNKALEVIEAFWLFGIESERLDVLVHPQSIVHSLVSFCDGSQIAQLSETSMAGPIAYALSYPNGRIPRAMPTLDLAKLGRLDFMELDHVRFPAVKLAKQCLQAGPMSQIIFSVSNEVAVRNFIQGKISFMSIYSLVESALSRYSNRQMVEIEALSDLVSELDSEIENSLV